MLNAAREKGVKREQLELFCFTPTGYRIVSRLKSLPREPSESAHAMDRPVRPFARAPRQGRTELQRAQERDTVEKE